MPNLLPGSYDVTVSLEGFTDHTRTAVPVAAGAPVRVDATLAWAA
jgi:hypothetical protein